MMSFKKLFSSSLMILVVNSNVYAEKASSFSPILMDNLIMFVPTNIPNFVKFFDGVWIGTGMQNNHSGHWTIEMDIDSDNKSYLIKYPSLNCGGTLTLISSSNDRVDFLENLTYGLHRCINNGITSLVKTDQHKADFFWYKPTTTIRGWGKVERKN